MTAFIILVTALISILAFNNHQLTSRFIFNPYRINRRNEYYRFLTSGFLHANWLHLIINMFVLYFFGEAVEVYFIHYFGNTGYVLYIVMYILGIICASIFTYFKYKDSPHYNSLGASGAVSAVVFASILFQPFAPLYLYGIVAIPGIVFGILYLVYSAFMARREADNINHDAHFFGAVFGILFVIVIRPETGLDFINQLLEFFNLR
jgi:membrane associated rhomboid family serine protease